MFCHQRLDRGRGEIVGAHFSERASKAADRGSDGITDKYITHGSLPGMPRFGIECGIDDEF
jgi:hypothetical protein